MDFIFKKAYHPSFSRLFRKEILQIAQKCQEHHDICFDFIYDLEQIDFLEKEEELNQNERMKLENVFKLHKIDFLVCHQLWQKFGPKFKSLEINTVMYAIVYETNKSKSLIKETEKSDSFAEDIFMIF